MKVSYCSTCKGRLWQLEKTLMPNLLQLSKIDAEWIIVDYASPDGFADILMFNNLARSLMEQGKLKIYQHRLGMLPFSMPLAKNLAHHFATGEYVFNLDIDNFIGNSYEQIISLQENEYIWAVNQHPKSGLEGRLGMKRSVFEQLRGYDLDLVGAGYDDINLAARLDKQGFKLRVEKKVIPAVKNTATDTIMFVDTQNTPTELYRNSKKIHDMKMVSGQAVNCNGTTFVDGINLADLTTLLTVQ